ncbi:MAG: cadherin-like domain-containing protein, partial [Planctomycetales bacterium]|nr:cadherin-like domain-containing protein [Planctomycetales bacterium]
MEAVSELPTATRIDTLADIVISPIANNGIVDDTADNSLVISGTTVGVDDGQLVSIAVSGDVFSGTAAVQNNAWSVPIGDLSWLSDGSSYSVSVAVADVAGNSAATSSAFQLINTINDPPTLALAVSDYTILEGTGLQFNGAGAYDPDDPTLIYGWDLDGDGQFDDATGMSPIITWLDLVSLGRNDDGDYPGEVQVSDDEGLSAQATISLHIVNVAPDLSISSNFVATLLAGTAQVAGVYDDIMADPVTIIASKGNITDFGAGQFLWDYDATSDPFVRSLGPLNAGIAVHDSADGSGFVLFSSESVFARFADHPPLGGGVNGNAEHLVAVQFRGGQWYYSDDSDWILFVPVESDRIIARLDFDNDTANLVTAVTGDVNGIRQGTRANNLALTPNAFGGQADVGEFTLSGSFFHDAFGTVTITATDDEQATSSVDIAVLLGNVPPELTVAWPAISVVEGTQAAVNGGTWQPGSSTYGTPVADIGVVLDNGDGSWSWSLDNPGDEQSRRTVTVTVSDGQGAESVVQFDVEFTNADPVISMDSSEPITVLEGDMATRLISVTDVLLDNVSVVASIGIVTKNADGTWTWTYDATDDLPTTTVTITATDEDGGVANAEFGLTVANRPPLIAADSASLTVNEGDGVVTMTGTYEDVAADELELVPSLGQVVDQGDGTWLWSYDAVDDVSELVTITVADDDDGTAFATFDFTALNVAPLVTVGSNNVMGYEGVIASASGTWSDVPGDPLRFTPSIGEVVVNGNGTWEWTYAAADDLAPMLVTVSVVDNDGGEVEFEFTFSALNVSPSFTISLDEVIVPEDEPAANFGTITDVAGDTITLSSNLGDVSLDGFNNWTWDFADTHQPVAFDLGSTSSGVAVGANAIGMAYILYSEEDIAGRFTTTPSQMDVTFENAERMVVVREAAGSWEFNDGADWIPFAKRPTDRLLAEVDLGTGTVTLLQGANTVVAGIRVGYGFGDVLVSTGTLNSGGTLRQFSVAGTFFESDIATVVLIASDEDGGKSEAVFDVTIIAANDDPVALPDEHAVAEDDEAVEIPVLSNDSDIDRFDVISIESVDVTGTLGLVTVVDGFELRYDPSGQFEWLADGELATDTFSYTISDAAGSQSGATVVVTIVGANDAPISVVDSNVAEEDGAAATGNVLSNDSDVDNGDVLAVVAPGTFIGQYGEWTLSADGNYSYVVTDEAIDDDDVVADTFDFEVTDGEVVVASQFVVEIVGANDAPVALDDANNASDDGVAVVGNVLANDDDVDTGDVLSVANVGTQLGTYGTLTLSADGSYSYLVTDESLMATDAVDDVFAIDVSDGTDVVTSTLTIHITGVNNAPQAMLDSNHAADDGVTVFGNVLANDSDPDGGDVLVIVASGTFIGQYGEWTLSADGNYSYVVTDEAIDDGDVVADAFDFEVTDGEIVVSSQFVVEID